MNKPTIGIEIELPWQTMLRRVDQEAADILAESGSFYRLLGADRERVQQGFDAVDLAYKDTVQGVFGDDIKQKSDGYTEFAFSPQRDYSEIVEIADELYGKSILREGETYPMHVTLGGISARGNSWIILMAAELSGGASAERIRQINTWSQKGQAGIKQRSSAELELGYETGIEMRTLEATGLGNIDEVLRVAQTAGWLLLRLADGSAQAGDRWKDLKTFLERQADSRGVDIRTRWPNPQINSEPWERLSDAMLDDSWLEDVKNGIKTILLED